MNNCYVELRRPFGLKSGESKLAKILIAMFFMCVPVLAAEVEYSAKSDFLEDPFLAYGYNPTTRVITGYLAAFRVSPGRTDECKLVFKGSRSGLTVKYLAHAWVPRDRDQTGSGVSIVMEKNEPFLKFSKRSLGGDCDWILPFSTGPRVSETSDEVAVTMKVSEAGNWIGVYVISAKQAKFHSRPDSASVQKAYLVAGDLIYVYDEKPDWYFVQFDDDRKRKTAGWIRKADTVQP